MRREIFDGDHELFRDQVKRFVDKEVVPKIPHWNETGMCDREIWRRLGAEGFIAPSAPVEYGGSGADSLRRDRHRGARLRAHTRARSE
jgi:acyl-CoA dehydrogenase